MACHKPAAPDGTLSGEQHRVRAVAAAAECVDWAPRSRRSSWPLAGSGRAWHEASGGGRRAARAPSKYPAGHGLPSTRRALVAVRATAAHHVRLRPRGRAERQAAADPILRSPVWTRTRLDVERRLGFDQRATSDRRARVRGQGPRRRARSTPSGGRVLAAAGTKVEERRVVGIADAASAHDRRARRTSSRDPTGAALRVASAAMRGLRRGRRRRWRPAAACWQRRRPSTRRDRTEPGFATGSATLLLAPEHTSYQHWAPEGRGLAARPARGRTAPPPGFTCASSGSGAR